MVLAPRESGKLGKTGSSDLLGGRVPRPPISAQRENKWATKTASCGAFAGGAPAVPAES